MTTSLGKLGLILGSVMLAAALLNGILIKLLWPWFNTYALARPNARSLHSQPTPQGGGIAVVAATLAVSWLAATLIPEVDSRSMARICCLDGGHAGSGGGGRDR